jgi:hypothetical protein
MWFYMSQLDSEELTRMLSTAPYGLRAPEIIRQLTQKVSQPTLWRVLDKLQSEGRVIREGSARATRYHTAERGDLSTLRSQRLHQVAARRLVRDPSLLGIARARLQRLREVNPHGDVYHDRWEELLGGSFPHLLHAMTEPSEQADALRQESPFTVLVPADDRRRVFESFRAAA